MSSWSCQAFSFFGLYYFFILCSHSAITSASIVPLLQTVTISFLHKQNEKSLAFTRFQVNCLDSNCASILCFVLELKFRRFSQISFEWIDTVHCCVFYACVFMCFIWVFFWRIMPTVLEQTMIHWYCIEPSRNRMMLPIHAIELGLLNNSFPVRFG